MERLSRQEHSLYQEGVSLYLTGDNRRLQGFLQQSPLRTFERGLIKTRLHLRAAELAEAEKLLLTLSASPSIFLEAEKLFLWAGLEFQRGNFEEAARWNLDALVAYESLADRRGQFLTNYNLSADFNRVGLETLSYHYLLKAHKMAGNPQESGLILRARACHKSNNQEFEEANRLVDQALAEIDHLSPADRAITINVAADIRFRSGNWDEAQAMLKKSRGIRLNRERDRTDFELTVLEKILLSDKKLAVLPENLRGSLEYSLKWKILRNLQSGELLEATELWNNLRKQSPDDYLEGFKTKNPSLARGIFMSAVAKLLCSEKLSRFESLPESKSTLGNLELLIRSSPMPLRKEELIEKVWKTSYRPELDSRFYRLVSRLKHQKKLNILCINRAYRLAEPTL